jgi:hypothetical protein
LSRIPAALQFFEEFLSWDMRYPVEELVEWLKSTFGIEYEERKNLQLNIDQAELGELFELLKKSKNSEQQAYSDTLQILSLYALREKNNELGGSGVFGYRTWWLTTDTKTQRDFETMVGGDLNRRTSPYIRADFLYNYISLVPSTLTVDETFRKIFPILVGVNISHHIPIEVRQALQKYIMEHNKQIDKPSFSSKLKVLNNTLKSDPSYRTKAKVELWLDQQKKTFLQDL